MVAVFWLTAIVGTFGEPASSVSVLPPAKVQFCDPVVSPNLSPPMVRAPSSVTVRTAARLMVLKSAMRLTPLATRPLLQLLLALQLPLAFWIQTLLV